MLAVCFRKLWWRALRGLGFGRVSWNRQYSAGAWKCSSRSAHTLALVAKFCKGGKLIEFGCGEGELPHLLPAASYSEYLGIDISDKAIERAKIRTEQAGILRTTFQQANMAEWTGTSGASLVLAEECLYYLTPHEIEAFLMRCSRSLRAEGHILVIVHSAAKHAKTLEVCRRVCPVVGETLKGSRLYMILAPKREQFGACSSSLSASEMNEPGFRDECPS